MDPRAFIEIMATAERLKNTFRHSWTSEGRRESVAEHSWRISLMAMLLEKEFPDTDMNKVIKMCLIHMEKLLGSQRIQTGTACQIAGLTAGHSVHHIGGIAADQCHTAILGFQVAGLGGIAQILARAGKEHISFLQDTFLNGTIS